jgi:RHS repeat-associated protein
LTPLPLAYDQTQVDLTLELLALDLTNDPNPVRFDGKPPEYESPQIKVASLGAGSIMGLLSQVVTTAIPATPQVYYYINDHLGTPQVITDTQGQVVWQADYRPFGEADINLETVSNNFRFPGQYHDKETGLHYNWQRYYDPSTGRYLTPDPIGLAGGMNLFLYAKGNPVNIIDPFGLWGEDVHSGIGNSSYGTYTWAQQAGFSPNQAELISRGNQGTDSGFGSWQPVL